MKAGIHPNYYQATITCNCGNTFVPALPSPNFTLKFALSAILSILASRRQHRLADVSISSTASMVWQANKKLGKVEVFINLNLNLIVTIECALCEHSITFYRIGNFVSIR